MSEDWETINPDPMANEAQQLNMLKQRVEDHIANYHEFKNDMKTDMKEVQRTVWKANGILLVILALAEFILKLK